MTRLGWIAIPFLYDSFIHNSTPVYPGAVSSLLGGAAARARILHALGHKSGASAILAQTLAESRRKLVCGGAGR